MDGDGEVTEEEIIETRVRKGKEIFAQNFVNENVRGCYIIDFLCQASYNAMTGVLANKYVRTSIKCV